MLDPSDWHSFRSLAHRILDDAIDDLEHLRDQPVWKPIPDAVKAALHDAPVPNAGKPLELVYEQFKELIAPYSTGNRHPRFFGWVHGNGTPSGMMASLLAASLNANVGGREHAAVYVERAVIAWWAKLFGFPLESSGIITSGTSMATLLAVQVARTQALGADVRVSGLASSRLVGYAASSVHHCVAKAFEIAGLGSLALRSIAVTNAGQLDGVAVQTALEYDRRAGFQPFFLVGTAGTVDRGLCDDLLGLAELAAVEKLWFHVDGAFGAMAIVAPALRDRLAGIERADSVAMDFHKWMHVPYGAGLFVTRHAELHRATFADQAPYLARLAKGTAGGTPWFCDYGPELSRGFLALGVWMAMEEFGLERIGAAIEKNTQLASQLALELETIVGMHIFRPVPFNIVCARYEPTKIEPAAYDDLNAALVVEMQCAGTVVASTTRIDGNVVIRFNFTNHRVNDEDVPIIVSALQTAIRALA